MVINWTTNLGFSSQLHNQMYQHSEKRWRKYLFQFTQHDSMSASTLVISEIVRVFKQIFLKKQANFIKCLVMCDGKDPHKAVGRSCCIKM